MTQVFALVVAALIQTAPAPMAVVAELYPTEQACLTAKEAFDKDPWDNRVYAGGSACIKMELNKGKPV